MDMRNSTQICSLPFRTLPLPKTALAILFFFFAVQGSYAQISGTVFRDYNGNGLRGTTAPNVEPAVAGVIVNAYNAANTLVASYTTTATGSYTIPASGAAYNGTEGSNTGFVGSGTAVRLEFLIPAAAAALCGLSNNIDYNSSSGGAYGTSVQFVSGGATNANFAISNPADYASSTNPELYVSCFVAGNPTSSTGNSPGGDAFVKFNYNNTNSSPAATKLVSASVIGSTYGVAYSRQAKRVFTSAFLKRHVGLGSQGSGAIYMINPATAFPATTTTFYNLDANSFPTRCATGCPTYGPGTSYSLTGTNPAQTVSFLGNGEGVIGTNVERDLSGTAADPSFDVAAYGQIGKASLGDLEISDDGKYLFVVNLFDRKVYRLTLNDAFNPTSVVAVTSYALPNPPLRSSLGGGFATTYASDNANFYNGTLGYQR
jgi:hypothetical protein